MERWASLRFTIVVGTGATTEEAKAIAKRLESTKGIGQAGFKPTVHACADPTQDGTRLPSLPKQHVQPVRTPQGEQVQSAPSAHVEDVLLGDEVFQVPSRRRTPRDRGRIRQCEVTCTTSTAERPIKLYDVRARVAARGRDQAHLRGGPPRERKHKVIEQRAICLTDSASTTNGNDMSGWRRVC